MSDRDRLSEISHKLRTPLTVMMSTVNNFLDGAFGKTSPIQKEWLEKLSHHTQTLEHLLNEIIEMLKREGSGDNKLNLQPDVGASSSHAAVKNGVPSLGSSWTRKPKILVVDDEPDILDTIRQAMDLKGFESVTCGDGNQAKVLVKEISPDLVIMDVNLKDRNGIDVCREIKSEQSDFIPVLLITGQSDLSMKMNGDKNDPDDLLIKPFQIPELFTRVTSMLRLRKLHEDLERLTRQNRAA